MKKGITFIAVMTTVAIMLILVSTATISAFNVINNSKKTKYATELAYIKEAVENYYITYNDFPISESIKVGLDSLEDKTQFEDEDEDKNEDDNILLYKIDKEKLGISETVYGNETDGDESDIYTFSKKTKKVYYLKGVKIGNNIYYTLTDELKKMINYDKVSGSSVTSKVEEDKDSNPPTIKLGEKKHLISADGTEENYYITVEVTDDIGVKVVKFEREILDVNTAKTYFRTNGIELQEDIIQIDQDTKGITVYAEDNEGNVTIESKSF